MITAFKVSTRAWQGSNGDYHSNYIHEDGESEGW